MEELTVALDIEGVLADTHAATAARSDMLEPHECPPPQWDFPSEEHHEEFMHVSQNLWHNHNYEIPPVEDGLWKAVRRMADDHHVDIVTHRRNVDRQVQEWLAGYNIDYENFYATSKQKTQIGPHDVYIDDNPNVIRDVVQNDRHAFLVDRPYNNVVEDTKRVWRVSGVTEASELLSDPSTIASVKPP